MLVDGLDENEFDGAIRGDPVDSAIGDVEPDGTMASPLALERLIMPTRGFARLVEADSLNRAHPSHKLANDVSWTRLKALLGIRREGDSANHSGSVAV